MVRPADVIVFPKTAGLEAAAHQPQCD